MVATGERIPTVSAPPQVELILDASGSMKRKIGGRMMIDEAKDAMAQIIEGLPDVRVAHGQFTRVELKKEGQEVGTRVLGPIQKDETPLDRQGQGSTPSRW